MRTMDKSKPDIMKNIKAFTIVLIIWFAGELISGWIRDFIIIPGSILGFITLFILLQLKIVKLELMNDMADFFLKHVTLMLIPVAISFISYFDVIGANIIPILICGVVVTIISLVLTMKFTDILVSISEKRKKVADE